MRVFVSSTYVDLQDHRRAVRDTILRLDHHPVMMEDFGSGSVEPTRAALDRLDTCDALVGIYAHRYGIVPDGHTDPSLNRNSIVHVRLACTACATACSPTTYGRPNIGTRD